MFCLCLAGCETWDPEGVPQCEERPDLQLAEKEVWLSPQKTGSHQETDNGVWPMPNVRMLLAAMTASIGRTIRLVLGSVSPCDLAGFKACDDN